MDKFFTFIGDFKDPRVGGADSFCDRLSCRFTVFVLVVFATLVTARHYVGEPISCWCPPHFTSSHVDFTNKVGFCIYVNTSIRYSTNNHYINNQSKNMTN